MKDLTFARRMDGVEGSLITGILHSAGPDVIALSRGNPCVEAFPLDDIRRITSDILLQNPVGALQYSTSEGYTPLREAIGERLSRLYNFPRSADDYLITSGSMQAADLVTKVLVNEGDVVICEEPTYVGCLNAFRSYGARLVGVPMEDDGICVDALEAALKNNPDAKLIYLIPTFQNPTGVTMSAEKRRAVYALAVRFGVPILEDNPYGDLRFAGEDVPPIKQLDDEGLVIYAGSFSKVMAPAFRIGFVCASKAIMEKLVVAKQAADVHSNILSQQICHKFMTECDFEAHIASLRSIYGERAALMLDEMDKAINPAVTFTRPQGGFFIMAFLPEGYDSMKFCSESVRRGVGAVPGLAFATDTSGTYRYFRLNYSAPSKAEIKKGIELLGKFTYDYLK